MLELVRAESDLRRDLSLQVFNGVADVRPTKAMWISEAFVSNHRPAKSG